MKIKPDHYSEFAPIYHQMVTHMPNWGAWLRSVLPFVVGPRVLDVSFGTGYILRQLVGKYHLFGAERNQEMIGVAKKTLKNLPDPIYIHQADAMYLPYKNASFNTVVNTMALSSYDNPGKGLSEMSRVLVPGGVLLILDVSSPPNGDKIGKALSRLWQNSPGYGFETEKWLGDHGFEKDVMGLGGFGSVQLIIARKEKRDKNTIISHSQL